MKPGAKKYIAIIILIKDMTQSEETLEPGLIETLKEASDEYIY